MGTQVESLKKAIRPASHLLIERVPWREGEGYLVTAPTLAPPGKRFFRTWGAVLDFIVQSLEPR